jgi:hypothetical protein
MVLLDAVGIGAGAGTWQRLFFALVGAARWQELPAALMGAGPMSASCGDGPLQISLGWISIGPIASHLRGAVPPLATVDLACTVRCGVQR